MKTIIRAYKTELRPNREQAETLVRWCGVSRFVWNRALYVRSYMYEHFGVRMNQQYAKLPDGTTDKDLSLQKLFPWLRDHAEMEWLGEPPSSVILAALLDQDRAMSHFFRRLKAGEKPGYPRYKPRHVRRCRIYGAITIDEKRVKVPKLGWIRLKERGYVQAGSRVIFAAISERAGRWFVSVSVEEPIPERKAEGPAVAAHPGVRDFLTIADEAGREDRIGNRRALEYYQKRLRRLQRRLARQQKGSANRQKTRDAIAKLHLRIASIRQDATHKATHRVTRGISPEKIVIQAWRVREMLQSDSDLPKWLERRIKRGIADANFGELLRQIRYKADWYGSEVIEIDPDVPVSKTCSRCGVVKEDFGMEQTFRCSSCGYAADRETNASRNLLAMLADVTDEK